MLARGRPQLLTFRASWSTTKSSPTKPPVRQLFERLQHQHRADEHRRDRWAAATRGEQVRGVCFFEQLVAVIGEKGRDGAVLDEATAEGRGVEELTVGTGSSLHRSNSHRRRSRSRALGAGEQINSARNGGVAGGLVGELAPGVGAQIPRLERDSPRVRPVRPTTAVPAHGAQGLGRKCRGEKVRPYPPGPCFNPPPRRRCRHPPNLRSPRRPPPGGSRDAGRPSPGSSSSPSSPSSR